MRWALALLAYAFKAFFWMRTMKPAEAVILTIAGWLLVAVMFAILEQRKERKSEVICWDKSQERYGHELCEYKLRNAASPQPTMR